MEWDLGLEGLGVLAAMSLGFGVLAAFIVGGSTAYRLTGAATTTVACFAIGLLVSEWLFGWATEEELQPNVDGLSRDEVLLSSVITTAVVVLVMRRIGRRTGAGPRHAARPTRAG